MKIPEKRAVVLSTPQARHLLDLLEERKARNLNNFRIRKSFGHGQYKKGDQQLFQFADGQAVLELPQIEEIARYSNDGGKIVALHTGAPDCEVGMSHLREILGILRDPYNMDKQISPTNGEIEVFFSYVPYSKADLGFSIGGNVKAKWLFKELIETYAVSRFHGIDIHFYKEKIPWIHEFPINALSVEEVMLQSVLDATRKTIDDYIVIGPDGTSRFEGAESITFEKRRTTDQERVETYVDETTMKMLAGKNVLFYDDMIQSGGTMNAAMMAISDVVNSLIVVAVHGVLQSGVDRIAKACREIGAEFYLSNTTDVTHPYVNVVDVAPFIERSLMEI